MEQGNRTKRRRLQPKFDNDDDDDGTLNIIKPYPTRSRSNTNNNTPSNTPSPANKQNTNSNQSSSSSSDLSPIQIPKKKALNMKINQKTNGDLDLTRIPKRPLKEEKK